ncbi:putative transmembrane protein [Crotalus adamanteus]|uniref:Transmembrane protein n=1 Tax=Crotalus adamanteus TaxID=8729 RepID=A0AAW1APL4_CROAD
MGRSVQSASCLSRIMGSSSIIGYTIFQNTVRSPEMLSYSNHLGRIAIISSRCLLLHMGNVLSTSSQQVTCAALCLYSTGVFLVSFVVSFLAILALTASSQGFLNCVVYGWTQHMLHCVKRKACRDVNTQTPLLRSQKRFYASTLPARIQTVAEPSSPSTMTVL